MKQNDIDVYILHDWDLFKRVLFHKYATVKGRASRGEFWRFIKSLIMYKIIILFAMRMVYHLFGGGQALIYTYMAIISILVLALITPIICLLIRRLHDTNQSAWNLIIGLVPMVGPIWLLVCTFLKGTSGPNKYGDETAQIHITPDMHQQLGLLPSPKQDFGTITAFLAGFITLAIISVLFQGIEIAIGLFS